MKNYYLLFIAIIFGLTAHSQGYEFGIVHNTGNNFSVVAIPDFDGTDTDISDVGFGVMLPTGNIDVANLSQFNGRSWTSNEVTASQLTGLGLGDGTRDLFILNMPPGQTILSHTSGQPIILVSFDVTNMPTTGELSILPNNDPIATGLGGVADSFYNSNIDMTTTQDYFSGLAVGMESFMFDTLSLDEAVLVDQNLNIYPNPTSDVVHIKSPQSISSLRLFDLQGKIVFERQNHLNQIDLKLLESGVYFIRVVLMNGSEFQKKIIKK